MRGSPRTPGPATQSRWKTIAWVIGPLAIVLAFAFLVFQPTFDLSATTSPTPSASLVATATPFPTAAWNPIDASSLAIHAVPFDATATVNDLAVAGTRLIATGAKDDAPAAWYSDDGGETWTAASLQTQAPPRTGAKIDIRSVAAFGSTLAALGQWHQGDAEPFAAGIWTSTDSGEHWIGQAADAVPRNISGLESGQIGFVTSPGGATVLTSHDGLQWDELPSDPLLRGVSATGFAVSGRQIILTVDRLISNSDSAPMLTIPLFWLYTDGEGWSTVPRGDGGPAYVRSIIGDGSGFEAGGAAFSVPEDFESSQPTLWQSADGRQWHPRRLSKAFGHEVDRIARGGLGTLAIGGEPGVMPGAGWLVPNRSDRAIQEYEMDWDVLTVVGLGDRFVAFAQCGVEASEGCTGPQMLIITASDVPYAAPSPR